MKKVLVVAENLSIDNGLGRYALDIVRGLINHYQVFILTSNPGQTNWQRFNIPVFLLPSWIRLNNPIVNFIQSLRYLGLTRQVDFIHFCSDFPYCVLFSWIPFFNKPRFISAHGTFSIAPLDHWLHKYSLRRAFKKAKKVISGSSFTKKQILKRVKLKNIIVINHGVDFNKFYRTDIIISKKNSQMLLGVGVLKNRKGFDISIQAVAQLKSEFPYLKYYIVGDQSNVEYFNYLKQLVTDNNLKEVVIFLKNISDEDLINLYYQTDVFILTPVVVKGNKFEGFGLVYLEAGACAKPVIGTTDCGAEDAVKDGYSGLLVPQNDVQATVQAIRKLLLNPDLARKLGANGSQLARQSDWDNVFKKYQAIYESFIN